MTDWSDIDAELSLWSQPACLWWRDDDATAATPALDVLFALSETHAVPLHLAVIPQPLEDSLIDRLHQTVAPQSVRILQHGFDHQSFARDGQRKVELGGNQPLHAIHRKLRQGRGKLIEYFPEHYLDILVPPWNRLDEKVRASLPDTAYQCLSVLGDPKPGEATTQPLLPELNVHIDIIDWKNRSFSGEARVLDKLLRRLQYQRQQGLADVPIGLMTHHWIHDQACNTFLARFFQACQQRGLHWPQDQALLRSALQVAPAQPAQNSAQD